MFFRIYVFGGYGPPLDGYLNDRGHYTMDTGPYVSHTSLDMIQKMTVYSLLKMKRDFSQNIKIILCSIVVGIQGLE